nr:hypothetical protein [Brucella anthropi]
MTRRSSLLPSQADITRMLKAARTAGYSQAQVTVHPNGSIEVSAADVALPPSAVELSPYEEWKQKNARKT